MTVGISLIRVSLPAINSAPVGDGFDNGWNRLHRAEVLCTRAMYVILEFLNIDRNCRSDGRIYTLYLSNMYNYTRPSIYQRKCRVEATIKCGAHSRSPNYW